MRERYRKLYDRIMDSYRKRSIQMLITLSFSVLSILGMALMGSALYGRFAASVREVAVEDSKKLMDQVIYINAEINYKREELKLDK